MIKAFFVKRAFNRFDVAFLEQVNVTRQGISILSQSCLQLDFHITTVLKL